MNGGIQLLTAKYQKSLAEAALLVKMTLFQLFSSEQIPKEYIIVSDFGTIRIEKHVFRKKNYQNRVYAIRIWVNADLT